MGNTSYRVEEYLGYSGDEMVAVSIGRIKQAREEMYKKHQEVLSKYGWSNLNISLEILDKLIAESEGE